MAKVTKDKFEGYHFSGRVVGCRCWTFKTTGLRAVLIEVEYSKPKNGGIYACNIGPTIKIMLTEAQRYDVVCDRAENYGEERKPGVFYDGLLEEGTELWCEGTVTKQDMAQYGRYLVPAANMEGGVTFDTTGKYLLDVGKCPQFYSKSSDGKSRYVGGDDAALI